MRREDVPQDKGLFGPWHGINYAVDEKGRYTLVPSAGWEPQTIANTLSWEPVTEAVEKARMAVEAGMKSPLALYMALHLMDVSLLARYVGLSCWRVRRHLRPDVFPGDAHDVVPILPHGHH
ncbi:MAG: hypothetical protein P8165_04025 [Deltaproteobacteria bacterium]